MSNLLSLTLAVAMLAMACAIASHPGDDVHFVQRPAAVAATA